MNLLPAFKDDSLSNTAEWVNTVGTKFALATPDDPFGFDYSLPSGQTQSNIDFVHLLTSKYSTPNALLAETLNQAANGATAPQVPNENQNQTGPVSSAAATNGNDMSPPGPGIGDGLGSIKVADYSPTTFAQQASSLLAAHVANGAAVSASASTAPNSTAPSPSLLPNCANGGPNTFNLDDITTPYGSPRMSSGYNSPAFQMSPTPGLTTSGCVTVNSTPAPRTISRCSTRSTNTNGDKDGEPKEEPKQLLKQTASGFKPKKPHLCPYPNCERNTRTFRSNADLERHIRSHRGERPHKCPAIGCGKAYGQRNKMANHVKQQHPPLFPMVDTGRTRGPRRVLAEAAANGAASRTPSAASSAASTPNSSVLHTPTRPAPYPSHANLMLQRQMLGNPNVMLHHPVPQVMRAPAPQLQLPSPRLRNPYEAYQWQ